LNDFTLESINSSKLSFLLKKSESLWRKQSKLFQSTFILTNSIGSDTKVNTIGGDGGGVIKASWTISDPDTLLFSLLPNKRLSLPSFFGLSNTNTLYG